MYSITEGDGKWILGKQMKYGNEVCVVCLSVLVSYTRKTDESENSMIRDIIIIVLVCLLQEYIKRKL